MTKQRTTVALALVAVFGWPIALASAQAAGTPGAGPGSPPPPPPAGAQPSDPQPSPAPAGPSVPMQAPPSGPSSEEPTPTTGTSPEQGFPTTVFGAPTAPKTTRRVRRTKPLVTTVGMLPPSPDFGSEADLVSTADEDTPASRPRRWVYSLKGFLRAPMRVSFGPKNSQTPGTEAHSPPRTIGLNTDDWNYIGLTPGPTAQLHLNVSNANVSGNVIIAASTISDSGYRDLDQMGGISQAYVTLTSPQLFGSMGGVAWTVGAFSNRYGVAGPRQNSTGYYGTYLFGRTHVAGEALTADLDLGNDLELVLEHGFGAKIEVIPFIQLNHNPPPVRAVYLPDQGPVPQGSNFVHHAHAALLVGDWLRVAAHYMTSWTPNDNDASTGAHPEGRLTVVGGEVHLDSPTVGSGYIGYSHTDANSVLPLSDGIQVLHGTTGFSFKQNYFGPLAAVPTAGASAQLLGPSSVHDDTGKVDSVLAQYVIKLSPLLGGSPLGPDVALAVYGMFNHVKTYNLQADKFKFGAEVEVTPIRLISIGARVDRVSPDGHNDRVSYTAISPRVVLHSNWLSKEYIILSYTRFILGDDVKPTTAFPYDQYNYPKADPNLLVLSAAVSF